MGGDGRGEGRGKSPGRLGDGREVRQGMEKMRMRRAAFGVLPALSTHLIGTKFRF